MCRKLNRQFLLRIEVDGLSDEIEPSEIGDHMGFSPCVHKDLSVVCVASNKLVTSCHGICYCVSHN